MRKAILKIMATEVNVAVFESNEIRVIKRIKNDSELTQQVANLLAPMEVDELVVLFPITPSKEISDTTRSLDEIGDSYLVINKEDLKAIDEIVTSCGIRKHTVGTMKSVYDRLIGRDDNLILFDDSGTGQVVLIGYKGVAEICELVSPADMTKQMSKMSDSINVINAEYAMKRIVDQLTHVIHPDIEEKHLEAFGDLFIANTLDLSNNSVQDKSVYEKKIRDAKSRERIINLVRGDSPDQKEAEEVSEKKVVSHEKMGSTVMLSLIGLTILLTLINIFFGSKEETIEAFDSESIRLYSSLIDSHNDGSFPYSQVTEKIANIKSYDSMNNIESIEYRMGLVSVTAKSEEKESLISLVGKVQESYEFYGQPILSSEEISEEEKIYVLEFNLVQ